MSFNPVDFYKLSILMQSQATGDNAELRSVLSRTYYAALICSRDAANLNPPYGKNSHSFIISHYESANPIIANSLKLLRRNRVRADYQPDKSCLPAHGNSSLTECHKILKSLNLIV